MIVKCDHYLHLVKAYRSAPKKFCRIDAIERYCVDMKCLKCRGAKRYSYINVAYASCIDPNHQCFEISTLFSFWKSIFSFIFGLDRHLYLSRTGSKAHKHQIQKLSLLFQNYENVFQHFTNIPISKIPKNVSELFKNVSKFS